jgi:group I intron endonuclease
MGVIYLITNLLNGKKYIGLDVKNYQNRWKDHIRCSKEDNPKQLIDRKIRQYGLGNFEYKELFKSENIEELKEKEMFFIAFFDTLVYNRKGYNLTSGGDGCKNFKMPFDKIHKGAKHYMFGKKQPLESNIKRRETMRKVRKQQPNPFTFPEGRKKISELAKMRKGMLNPNFKHGRRVNGKYDSGYTKNYYRQHKNEIKAKARQRYLLSREKELEQARLYRLTHKKVDGHWLKK